MRKTVNRLTFISAAALLAGFAPTPARAARGDLISLEPLLTYSKKNLDLTKRVLGMKPPSPLLPSRSGVAAYKIIYETRDLRDSVNLASGLVLVPSSLGGPFPVVSYQHSTALNREAVPSRALVSLESAASALVYASMGMIVAAPDYLGLGDSPGAHPYLNAQTEASAARDLLLALPAALTKLGQTTDGKLFLAGYSQGGHATMALHRALDLNPVPGLGVVASVPMSGPYDLSQTCLSTAISGNTTGAGTSNVADLLCMAEQSDPAQTLRLDTYVGAAEASVIRELFDGSHSEGEISSQLPADTRALFLPGILASLFFDPTNALARIIRANDVYAWKALEPVLLIYASGDHTVSSLNSLKAAQTMTALGGSVTTFDVGAQYDHLDAALPALVRSYEYLDMLR